MAIATWDDRFATGNLAIDGQHRKLFEMVNGLHDALLAGHGREQMGPTLKALAAYTHDHFLTEERMMTQLSYPGLPEHKRKHDELEDKVVRLVADHETGKLTLPLTLARFLAEWVAHHIEEEDIKLARWMQARSA
jgi:hemerythrin-like metal-binding protein